MDAEAVKHLGGLCQLLGVVVVVWDLLGLTRYRGDLDRAVARLRGWWARVVAAVRTALGRPGWNVTVHAQAAGVTAATGQVTVRAFPGPFAAQPEQSVEAQLEALARLVNRLREEVMREPQERDRAITQAREQLRGEQRTEADRLQAASDALRGQFEELREVTTGGVRLRWEGVPPLLVGIVFTTWPDGVADVLPDWPPLRVVVSFIVVYILARFSWGWWLRHGQDWPAESGPRVGMAVPWHGPPRQPPRTG
jgi:hypothetical protein